MQDSFSISAKDLRFKGGVKKPHYVIYYLRVNSAHSYLEQPGSCNHTTWQTPPPPAVTQEDDKCNKSIPSNKSNYGGGRDLPKLV